MGIEHSSSQPGSNWRTGQVLLMACMTLVLGLAVGYLLRGSAPTTVPVQAASIPDAPHPAMSMPAPTNAAPAPPQQQQKMPSLDDMKRMADKQAAPLLAKLKTDPKNAALLNDIGTMYRATHQFKEAASYYRR